MSSVQIFVYNLGHGLAGTSFYQQRRVKDILLSSVVVYKREYFYGSFGICASPPATTILGCPYDVHEMGSTDVPQPVFEDFLRGLANAAFRPEKMNLFTHSCNDFSDKAVHFLTTTHAPEQLVNLPTRIAGSVLGYVVRNIVDKVSASLPRLQPHQAPN